MHSLHCIVGSDFWQGQWWEGGAKEGRGEGRGQVKKEKEREVRELAKGRKGEWRRQERGRERGNCEKEEETKEKMVIEKRKRGKVREQKTLRYKWKK